MAVLVICILLCVMCIFIGITMGEKEKEDRAEITAKISRYSAKTGYTEREHRKWGHVDFGFDDRSRRMRVEKQFYPYKDIYGFEIHYEPLPTKTTVHTSAGSAIGRSMVGGALFGPIGAIAGAATAKKAVTVKGGGQKMTGATLYTRGAKIELRSYAIDRDEDGTDATLVDAYHKFQWILQSNNG